MKYTRASVVILTVFIVTAVVACGKNQGTTGLSGPINDGTFSIPTTVVVNTAPYGSVAEAVAGAPDVDWEGDTTAANAATLAFAANELRDHLSLVGIVTRFSSPAEASRIGEIFLVLNGDPKSQSLIADLDIDFDGMGEQGFEIGWVDQNVYVAAASRTGLLYGVYRLLDHIGFAWYDPGVISSPDIDVDNVQWMTIREQPKVEYRGFWIFGDQLLSDDYTIWLARNRFNTAAGATKWMSELLGIREWAGGHEILQQEFSVSGLFEQQPEWFSLINGSRRPVAETGTYFNPAFGNPDAANYFSDRLIERLADGDLRDVDVLNIWPSDSRSGRFDQSALAISIGNETDNLLTFYGIVTTRLRQAFDDGVLNRLVTVGGISYYETWRPPTRASAIAELENTNYLHIFYLNERSWSGPITSDPENSESNWSILDNLAQWEAAADFRFGVVEYYNYSIYAALPLNDFEHLAENYRSLALDGRVLFAYMHPLLTNPGPRRFTNELLGKLGWEDMDASVIEREAYLDGVAAAYFKRRYGQNAAAWREIYVTMARSVDNAAEIFGHNSLNWLLFQDIFWASPPYTPAEVLNLLSLYRTGGVQDLPTFPERGFRRANFRGLNQSIQLQEVAAASWEKVLAQTTDPSIRAAMESDIVWFESTRSRYRLMAASADYVVAKASALDLAEFRDGIRTEVDYLATTPTTNDTISPVNQRLFLNYHRRLAELD